MEKIILYSIFCLFAYDDVKTNDLELHFTEVI